ncbi:MAG: anion permease [Phycisphaerales bacterium]|nr:MAG: anion permease [Phycisphaerales bacterium]
MAVGLGLSSMLLIVPMAIAASCAFMMPVATRPNAIVFGSGEITIPQMCKAGLWLNLVGIALVVLLAYLVVVPVLGIEQL